MGFALPVLLALFLQTMYGAVDMLIVGQFGNAASVSAVSTGSWMMQVITSAIVGLAMGTTILLGQKIGEGRLSDAGRVVGASICMFIVAYNVLGSIFRGMGNSKMPLITVAIACVVNIAGDLLLVGGFHLGAAGAAIATVFAQAVSVLLSFVIIRKQKFPFEFGKEYIKFHKGYVPAVLRLGFPIALQDVLVSASFLAITAIINTLGVIASAGVGVAEKICGFVLLIPSACS